jgi:hypothetical protein
MHRTPQTRQTMDGGFLNAAGLALVLVPVPVPEEPVGGPDACLVFVHSGCAGSAGGGGGGFCTWED